jgi:hypothetical protein
MVFLEQPISFTSVAQVENFPKPKTHIQPLVKPKFNPSRKPKKKKNKENWFQNLKHTFNHSQTQV